MSGLNKRRNLRKLLCNTRTGEKIIAKLVIIFEQMAKCLNLLRVYESNT